MDDTLPLRAPTIVAPEAGRVYAMGPLTAIFKADRAETGQAYSVSEWWLEPGTRGPGVHNHPEDHVFYVIAGTVHLRLRDEWSAHAQGAYVIIPGQTPHDFENRGAARAGFIAFTAPGGFEEHMPHIEAVGEGGG